jgi:hypothetical protein
VQQVCLSTASNPTPLRVLTGCEGDAIVAIRWSVPVGSLAIRDTDVLFLE